MHKLFVVFQGTDPNGRKVTIKTICNATVPAVIDASQRIRRNLTNITFVRSEPLRATVH